MIKRYNGTAWNAVTYCKNFNGTEQFTYFPVVANTFANAISSWTIKGNEQHTGTPAPGNPIRGVGEETANLSSFEKGGVSSSTGNDIPYSETGAQLRSLYIPCEEGDNFTLSASQYNFHTFAVFYDENKEYLSRSSIVTANEARNFTAPSNAKFFRVTVYHGSSSEIYPAEIEGFYVMLNTGSTALPYEPFGYKIPISSGNATTPVYISAPLRKSLDGTVFDTLDSTGLVTYNVDEYGAPLVTPTTATVTVPTITSALGRTVISFGTTIQPSEFDMTYHGWHSHIPSIRSNNAWS